MGGGASVRAYSQDLQDLGIIKLLAICCQDVYHFDGTHLGSKLQLLSSGIENAGTETNLQYGLYKILEGDHASEIILWSVLLLSFTQHSYTP
jgi:hypothetical protein